MAVPVTQIIDDGDRNLVIHVVGEADVAGGTIVDISTLTAKSTGAQPTKVRIDQIQYETDATVKIDDTVQTQFVAPPGQDTKNYRYGAMITCAAGDIVIPAPAAAANYTMTISFTKKYD